ncbi:hypothetical protein niasHT_016414 [Heterodera trifolii]|uniref:Uncharacterized protein n=1 Tax=Heterodera trifolii TaxID=157864 RepID=A0ABD2LJ09_9BILA
MSNFFDSNNNTYAETAYAPTTDNNIPDAQRWWIWADEIDQPSAERQIILGVSLSWLGVDISIGACVPVPFQQHERPGVALLVNDIPMPIYTVETPWWIHQLQPHRQQQPNPHQIVMEDGVQQQQHPQPYPTDHWTPSDNNGEEGEDEDYSGERNAIRQMLADTPWSPCSPRQYAHAECRHDKENMPLAETPKSSGRFLPPPSKRGILSVCASTQKPYWFSSHRFDTRTHSTGGRTASATLNAGGSQTIGKKVQTEWTPIQMYHLCAEITPCGRPSTPSFNVGDPHEIGEEMQIRRAQIQMHHLCTEIATQSLSGVPKSERAVRVLLRKGCMRGSAQY